MRVRQVKEEDLEKVIDLFNKIYGDRSLYYVRTPQFYDYLLIKRPGVGMENIFVAEEGDDILGFAAMGIKEAGTASIICIYEIMAVTKEVFGTLLSKIEEIGKEKKCAYMELTTSSLSDAASYLEDSGFLKARELAVMGYLTNARNFLSPFVEKALSDGSFKEDVTVRFTIGEETLILKLPEGKLGTNGKCDMEVSMSPADFLSLLLKTVSFFSLLVRGRIRVRPLSKIMSAHRVTSYVAQPLKSIIPSTELTFIR